MLVVVLVLVVLVGVLVVVLMVVLMANGIVVIRYFSHWDNICKPYNYSGCGANLNHFLSEVNNCEY